MAQRLSFTSPKLSLAFSLSLSQSSIVSRPELLFTPPPPPCFLYLLPFFSMPSNWLLILPGRNDLFNPQANAHLDLWSLPPISLQKLTIKQIKHFTSSLKWCKHAFLQNALELLKIRHTALFHYTHLFYVILYNPQRNCTILNVSDLKVEELEAGKIAHHIRHLLTNLATWVQFLENLMVEELTSKSCPLTFIHEPWHEWACLLTLSKILEQENSLVGVFA